MEHTGLELSTLGLSTLGLSTLGLSTLGLSTVGSITRVVDEWPTGQEVLDTLTFSAGYNTSLVILGASLLGLAAGVIGVFSLLRRRSLVSDALSHATLPGIALAYIIVTWSGGDGRTLPVLLLGAGVTATLAVISIQAILRFTRLAEDAAIGIVLSVSFGVGIVLLSFIQKNVPERAAGLGRFIYGQTAALSIGDAQLMGWIAVAAIAATFFLRKELATLCFNDAFARVQGWPVSALDLLLMAMVVVVTVAGLQAVGLLLVVAMLVLPPVTARFWTERLNRLVLLSGSIGALCGYLGATVSALFPRKPAGAVIVLTAGALFTVSLVFAPSRGILAAAWRRSRLRLRIAREHFLELGFEHRDSTRQTGCVRKSELVELARLRGWSWAFRRRVVRMLVRKREVEPTGEDYPLTPKGYSRGASVSRNHKLWEQYLVSHADTAPSHVDWSVDQVEHVLSKELVSELERSLHARGVELPARFEYPAAEASLRTGSASDPASSPDGRFSSGSAVDKRGIAPSDSPELQ